LVLAKIPPKTKGVTLYITLEPCNHWGQTPPCVDAIIDYGIDTVVFAYKDPNPVVARNNSSELLRKKGVKVLHIPLAEIDAFYQSYAYWTRTRTPWVTIKLAVSLDGKIAGSQGLPQQLSNALCSDFTHEKRKNSDVILSSATTIQNDNPLLNVRLANQEQGKKLAIIDSHLNLSSDARIFTSATFCHIYHSDRLKPQMQHSKCQFHPIAETQGLLDLPHIISHLGGLGYHDVWVEVGAGLFAAFHEQGLVQQTYLYVTPTLLGGDALSGFQKTTLFEKRHHLEWIPMGNNALACFDWMEGSCLQV
jgi:diaminohydroxyphosphoribosylaminopyrimidine deaminase/5-amino-6-(5-phosphoribosylamino)uracil reductase